MRIPQTLEVVGTHKRNTLTGVMARSEIRWWLAYYYEINFGIFTTDMQKHTLTKIYTYLAPEYVKK